MQNKVQQPAPIVILTPHGDKEWRSKDGLYHRADGPALHRVLDRQVADAQHRAPRVCGCTVPGGRIGEYVVTWGA